MSGRPAEYWPRFSELYSVRQRTDSVEHGGYSPYFPSMDGVSPATLYDAGGYAAYVDRMFALRPKHPIQGQRLRWVYTQNYNMQPHYGQQYPDRAPPDAGVNGLNSRAWNRQRLRAVVARPV